MIGRQIDLFRLFGFQVRIDTTWFLLVILITWTLATGYFPSAVPDLTVESYWVLGALGALGLFVSIVVHELSHSLVARNYGVEMKGITLFIFGGVAEMTEEPPSPKAELAIALAGPVASVGVAGVFFILRVLLLGAPGAEPAAAAAGYLALVNAILVVFNMVPAFPLDGGRVLRSILWKLKGSYRWASRVTSRLGAGFGTFLIVFGLLNALLGSLLAGVWWFLIGLFVRGASTLSYRQVVLRAALAGEPVRRFMTERPVTVPAAVSIRELVEDYVYRHHFKLFPVLRGELLVGCVSTREIKAVPRGEWTRQSVASIVRPCDDSNTTAPDDDALDALTTMSRENSSRLLVVEDGRLVGVLALKDLLSYIAAKIELEDLPADDGELPAATGSA